MKRLLAAVLAAALALHPGLAAAANIERPAVLPGVSLPGAPLSAAPQLPALPAAAVSVLPVPAALPAPAIPVASPAAAAPQAPKAAPTAALPRAQAIAAPTQPGAAASDDKTSLDARWDAGMAGAATQDSSAVEAAPSAGPAPLSAAHAQRLDAALQDLNRVPAPRVWRGKASAAAAWATLAGAGVLAHAPFDRVGPLVIGLVMAPMMSLMWAVIAGSMSSLKAPAGRPDDAAAQGRWDAWLAKVAPLAEDARLPPPAKLTLRGGSAVQAAAGGPPLEYELVVHGGMEHFPADQQEAVLRHELGHIRHRDSASAAAQIFLATIGPMAALMAGAIADARTWIALPIVAATVPFWFASKRMDEYHADQYAAHAQGSAAPLIRFFVSDAEDRETAVRAAEGLPPAPKPLWRRSWAALKGVVAGHPSHEKRIARLLKLSGK